MTKNIIRHTHERIFLAEHIPVLTDNRQSVHIRIDHKAHIRLTGLEQVTDLGQMLWKGFGIMREMTIRRTVQFDNILYANGSQNCRYSQTAYRVHAVDSHREMTFLYRLHVHQRQFQYLLHMVWQIILGGHMSQVIHLRKREVFGLSNRQHFLAFRIIEELTLLVEQFQGVPLFGVMAGRQDDASCGMLAGDRQLGRRSGCQTDVHHVIPHAHECTANNLLDHMSAQTRIAANHNHFIVRHRCTALGGIRSSKTNDVHWVESFTYAATNRTADA